MKKTALIILDGWGNGKHDETDAVYQANTPFMDKISSENPTAELLTDGEHVGLPEGQMGNSEVGHLNIGAGRVVYQDLVKINKAIESGELKDNPVLKEALKKASLPGKKLHFMGLVSDGGVHSHQDHLHALCDIAQQAGLEDVFIHCFTDGRDVDPKSAQRHIPRLQQHLKNSAGKIASVCGRYYAMDRDKRWERIKLAYDLLTEGKGEQVTDPLQGILSSYENDVTDEFVKPIVCVDDAGQPVGKIEEGDVVICYNFRTDRCREITMALTQQDFPEFDMKTIDLHYVTMTNYDKSFVGVNIIFDKDNLQRTLGEVISENGLKQIRIAETEKYPHVTYFFSGGREKEFEGETRIMVSSPKVATYDLQPEMSAPEVTDKIVTELEKGNVDFVCLNFANADMVGHTGVFEAAVRACETVDSCLQKVVEAGEKNGYSFIVIADHGNSDFMINSNGTPNTAHTKNPVPIVLIDSDHDSVRSGILADVAPTILELMGLPQPEEMTGKSLL